MVDPKEHAVRRKLFAHAFSKSSLKATWEIDVRKKVDIAVKKIKRDALVGEVDIMKFFMFMATDVIGHICFGESFRTLENEQVSSSLSKLCPITHFGSRKFNISKISDFRAK